MKHFKIAALAGALIISFLFIFTTVLRQNTSTVFKKFRSNHLSKIILRQKQKRTFRQLKNKKSPMLTARFRFISSLIWDKPQTRAGRL